MVATPASVYAAASFCATTFAFAMISVGFPDESPKCLECELLPCCHGGCHGWRWMRNGIGVCSEYRADPDSYVLGLLG